MMLFNDVVEEAVSQGATKTLLHITAVNAMEMPFV